MKVLGIVSSPRRGGNSELAVKELMMNLPENWEKEMIRLNELNIKNCTACYKCLPPDSKCHIRDDLNFYLDKIRQADKIVMAGPTYCFGGHTSFKAATDRLLSVSGNYEEFWDKECVLMGFYGYAGWDGLVREDMIIAAKQLNLKVIDYSVMLATLPGDSVKGRNLENVQALARALETGERQLGVTPGELACPMCLSGAIRLREDGTCRCSVCGAEGELEMQDGRLSISLSKDVFPHFTKIERSRHHEYLDIKKQEFLDNRQEIKGLQAKYADFDIWVKPEIKPE